VPVLARNPDPLGPVATTIVAVLLISASVVVVAGYYWFKVRWWLEARREKREHGDWPQAETQPPLS
jgi:hypothetical protein